MTHDFINSNTDKRCARAASKCIYSEFESNQLTTVCVATCNTRIVQYCVASCTTMILHWNTCPNYACAYKLTNPHFDSVIIHTYVYMYVCIYVCVYVCMYVYTFGFRDYTHINHTNITHSHAHTNRFAHPINPPQAVAASPRMPGQKSPRMPGQKKSAGRPEFSSSGYPDSDFTGYPDSASARLPGSSGQQRPSAGRADMNDPEVDTELLKILLPDL